MEHVFKCKLFLIHLGQNLSSMPKVSLLNVYLGTLVEASYAGDVPPFFSMAIVGVNIFV